VRKNNPWPESPQIFRVSSAHEEGGERLYKASTTKFVGDDTGTTKSLHATKGSWAENGRPTFAPMRISEFEPPADLVLLATGFTGPERNGLVSDLGWT
jgi:glutamate synthase (NADPH/NADH) small chain